ncbi:MAG: hypothetical protein Q4F06_08035 [Eubacteriales bacterium]|nr:hypothetical protein [Eubacteriales bacterium]
MKNKKLIVTTAVIMVLLYVVSGIFITKYIKNEREKQIMAEELEETKYKALVAIERYNNIDTDTYKLRIEESQKISEIEELVYEAYEANSRKLAEMREAEAQSARKREEEAYKSELESKRVKELQIQGEK